MFVSNYQMNYGGGLQHYSPRTSEVKQRKNAFVKSKALSLALS